MKRYASLLLFSATVLAPSAVFATGLSKSVLIGPKAVGMGGAFVAVADDPTAVFHNPAGMVQMKGHHFQVGTDALITNLDYTPPGAPVESAKREFLPVPNMGFVTDHYRPFALGFGIYFPHGNGGKFPAVSAVPTQPLEGRIFSMEIAPAIAYEFFDKLAIGGTIRLVRVSSSLKGQLIPMPDGTILTLEEMSGDSWTVGASAGFLYRPNEYFSVGANYRSKLKADLSSELTFTGLGSFEGTIEQTIPTLINAGVASRPIDGLTVGLSYEFERNSEIKNITAVVPALGQTLSLPQNYDDTHTIHVGAEYWFTDAVAGRVGYAKDYNRAVPDTANNRIVGDIASHEVSLGAAYVWNRWTLGLTWNGRFGEREVPVTAFNPGPGKYEAFLHSISAAASLAL